TGIVISLPRRRRYVSDPNLGKATDMWLLRGAAHGVSVAFPDAVAHVDKVQMCIDLYDVDRPMIAEGPDAWNVDGVIAAEHHGERTLFQDFADRHLRVGVALCGIGMHDVSVADVDNSDLVDRQIHFIVLVIVCAAMSEGEQGGRLANCPWAKARTRAV